MPCPNQTDADDLAVAVVPTLELAEIAFVLVRLDHIARSSGLAKGLVRCVIGL